MADFLDIEFNKQSLYLDCVYYLDCSNDYQGQFDRTMVAVSMVGRNKLGLMFVIVIVANVKFPHQEVVKQ